MVGRTLKGLGHWKLLVMAVTVLLFVQSADAAEITEVNDAADVNYFDNSEFPACEEFQIPGEPPDPLCQERVPVKDYYDMHVGVKFQQTYERMKINREKCARSERCLDVDDGLYNKELRYERVINQMDLDFDLGIYKDFEFHVKVPIILSDQRQYKYAKNGSDACQFQTNPDDPNCVDETNSTLDPSQNRIDIDSMGSAEDPFTDGFGTYRYFNIDPGADNWTQGPDRSGIGDVTFGLEWAIINDERYFAEVGRESPWWREHGRSSLVLGIDYTAPTAAIARRDNEAVGQGVHWLTTKIAGSRRYEFLDPYVEILFTLPIPSDTGLFQKYSASQERIGPGPRGHFSAGFEIIPWEVTPLSIDRRSEFAEPEISGEHRKLSIDLRGTLGFVAEGREYGPLFDAIGGSACQGMSYAQVTTTNPECGWMAQKFANAGEENIGSLDPFRDGGVNNQDPNTILTDDGITSYEGYGYVGARLGISLQPTKWVRLQTSFDFNYQQDRFLTFAKAGKDQRGRSTADANGVTRPDDGVEADGTVSFDDIKERNPVYNPTFDSVGKRLRSAENTIFTWNIGLVIQFP